MGGKILSPKKFGWKIFLTKKFGSKNFFDKQVWVEKYIYIEKYLASGSSNIGYFLRRRDQGDFPLWPGAAFNPQRPIPGPGYGRHDEPSSKGSAKIFRQRSRFAHYKSL